MTRIPASPLSRLLLGALLALALAQAACRHDTDERLGLDEKRQAQRFDPTTLAHYGELERAIDQPTASLLPRLESWRVVQNAKLELGVVGTDKHDTLEESWRMEIDAKGNTHVLHENSHDYGFEQYSVDGSFYVRPRYGKFVRRAIEGDEVDRARDEVEDVLAGYLAVLGRFAARIDDGPVETVGRPGRKITLTLAQSPARFRDTDPNHAWRGEIQATALTGEVVIDSATGAPLRARLDATWTEPRATKTGEAASADQVAVKLWFTSDTDSIGQVAPVVAPSESVPSPTRPRPLVDKQQLLEGLVTGPSPSER